MSLSNRMLKIHSSPKPCTPNFSRPIKGISQWILVGPKHKIVPPPRSKPRAMISLKHQGDELGLYTEQEERDFEHVSNLKHYKELITDSLTHAICNQDDHCDLNPLPEAPSYSLSRLEKKAKELVELRPWDYFLVKILAPILQALHMIAGCGGFVYAMTWAVWTVKTVIRVGKSCLYKPEPEPKFPASMLMELMGDSKPPEVVVSRKPTQSVRYKRGSSSDDENVEIPLTRI